MCGYRARTSFDQLRNLLARVRLQRGKGELAIWVVVEDKRDPTVAEIADAIKKDNLRAVGDADLSQLVFKLKFYLIELKVKQEQMICLLNHY